MSNLIAPNNWDQDYYPTAKVLVYEVEADKPMKITFDDVIVRDLFPIHVFEDYMYRGGDSVLDPNTNQVRYKLDFALFSDPKFGKVMYREGDGFWYMPKPGFIGADSLKYRLLLGQRSSNIATIELYVGAQAKFPACSMMHPPASLSLTKTAGYKYPMALCKPIYSTLGFRLPFTLSNYVGPVEEEPPPYVPVPVLKPILNPDGTPVLDSNGEPRYEEVYPDPPPAWDPKVNDRKIDFKIVVKETVVYSGTFTFNALGFLDGTQAFIDISVAKARLQNFDLQITIPQDYSVQMDIAEFKTKLS